MIAGHLTRALTLVNGLCLCLVICAVSLIASQAVGVIHVGLLLTAAVWQWWRWGGHGGSHDARRWWWEAASIAALLFFVADLFLVTRDLVGAALRLLAFIVAYHADNPQPARRARQTLGLTLIQMIAASASTTEVVFSALMTGYLFAALWTLAAIGAAEREAGRPAVGPASPAGDLRTPIGRLTLTTAPAILAVGVAVFFVIPHYGTGYFREQGKSIRRNLTGFSDRIELGSIGSIKKSHATVMRIERKGAEGPPSLPLRLRGVALDSFDGRVWERSVQETASLPQEPTGDVVVARDWLAAVPGEAAWPNGAPRDPRLRHGVLSLEVTLEPLESPVLFTPPYLISVRPPRVQSVHTDGHDNLFAAGPRMRRFPYATTSLATAPRPGDRPVTPLTEAERARYLQRPDVSARIVELGSRVTAGIEGDAARAHALESWLITSFRYSLDVNDAAVADPLTHLLVDRRPGHCEYFATALAVLLRLQEIPARVVTGFNGGEYSELTGQTIIRQSDAHSWVEAWLPETAWTALDATPADPEAASPSILARISGFLDEMEIAWDTYIVGLDLQDQQSAILEIRDWFDMATSGIFIAVREGVAAARRWIGVPDGGLPVPDGMVGVGTIAALMVVLAAAFTLAWRRLSATRAGLHPATEIFLRFEKNAAGGSGPRPPWMSPAEFARSLRAPEVADAYEAARYGPPGLVAAEMERLRATIEARQRSA